MAGGLGKIVIKKLLQKKSPQMIGLDIGTHFIKAVVLQRQEDKYRVQSVACEAISGNAFADREIKDFDAVSNALRKVKLALKEKHKHVATAVAGGSVLSKIVYMEPDQSDYELEAQIEIEADSLIPYPLDEVYLDFEQIATSQTHQGKVEVLLSAAHKDLIDSRITLLREVPFEPKVMDLEGYALGNAVRLFHQPDPEQALCCINIGATLLQLCVLQQDKVIYSKEHSFGVNSLIQDLSLINSMEKAETQQALINGTLPGDWRNSTYPVFLANLQQQINRALQVYVNANHTDRPERILICGGAANLSGLAADLQHDLGIAVQVFDPFAQMDISEQAQQQGAQNFAPQLAIAAGLASRSFSPWHI